MPWSVAFGAHFATGDYSTRWEGAPVRNKSEDLPCIHADSILRRIGENCRMSAFMKASACRTPCFTPEFSSYTYQIRFDDSALAKFITVE